MKCALAQIVGHNSFGTINLQRKEDKRHKIFVS
jgi:hypothetical protein